MALNIGTISSFILHLAILHWLMYLYKKKFFFNKIGKLNMFFFLLSLFFKVVTQTISKDLEDINAKVKGSAMGLRRERVRLIKDKVKEVLGKDVDIAVTDVNTDVEVNLNLNDLALTEGIVSISIKRTQAHSKG